jgi:hypothetical protein
MLWQKAIGGKGDVGSFGDLSTASLVQTFDISDYGSVTRWGMAISPDGTKIFSQDANKRVQCFEFGTPYDLSTYIGGTPPVATLTSQGNARGIYVSPDGTKLFSADDSLDRFWEYTFGTAFDVTTLNVGSPTADYSVGTNSVRAPMFTNNGANFYSSPTVGSGGQSIYYFLNDGTPYSPPPNGYSTQNFSGLNTNNYGGILFQPDGLNCYISDEAGGRRFRRFVLNSPFNLSSFTNPNDTFIASDALTYDISSDGRYIFYHANTVIYKIQLGPL